jgi:hypothetical protein
MATPNSHQTGVSITGGASWPGRVGTATVSVPLARATTNNEGLVLDVRYRLLRKMLRRFVTSAGGHDEPLLSMRWDEITSVDVAPRSLVAHLQGRKGCRFVVMRPGRLVPLVREIEQHDVPLRRVSGTIRWFVRGSAPPA